MKKELTVKKNTIKELIKLIEDDYFNPYFEGRARDFDSKPDKAKALIKDFLECRLIELEEEGEF